MKTSDPPIPDDDVRSRVERMRAGFINRIAHDMRTPLTTALLMVDLIRLSEPDDKDIEEYWRLLREQLQKEQDLVEDLLAAGRIETANLGFARTSLNLASLLPGLVDGSLPKNVVDERRADLTVPGDLPTVSSNGEALRTVIRHVVGNAVKFSAPGSVVRVTASTAEGGVVVTVADDGIGIPEEELTHVWEPYFRGAGNEVNATRGAGLGLDVVRRVVGALGARVSIASEPQKGTSVKIWLPIDHE